MDSGFSPDIQYSFIQFQYDEALLIQSLMSLREGRDQILPSHLATIWRNRANGFKSVLFAAMRLPSSCPASSVAWDIIFFPPVEEGIEYLSTSVEEAKRRKEREGGRKRRWQ